MPSAQTGEPERGEDHQDHERLKDVIRDFVLRTLGEPGRSGRVQVRPLWGNYYRVNILNGGDPGCVKITGSYFLATDGAGNVIESTPHLTGLA